MAKKSRRPRVPRLRRQLRAQAARILALPNNTIGRPLHVHLADRFHEVDVLLYPLGVRAETSGAPLPGVHLSALEQRVWNALAGGPLIGKELAVALDVANSPSFRAIVGNLRDRGVLRRSAGGGYERAPLGPLR